MSVLIHSARAPAQPGLAMALVLLLAIGCGTAAPSGAPAPPLPASPGGAASGHAPDGALVVLTLAGDKIGSVTEGTSQATWVWPPIVDSHVHLAFYPVGDKLAAHGIGAVVDLAAPESTIGAPAPVDVIAAGPMITRPNGYPLSSWGANGYGIGCADTACVIDTIDRLATKGVRVIKLPLDVGGLPRDFVEPAVEEAHRKGLKVAVHALSNEAAARAAAAGADILAHTPIEPLADATVEAWRGRVVISTLAAFGGSPAAVSNLRRLRAAGVTVLYGTDLGNLQIDGPSEQEVKLLRDVGLDDAAITAAMTTAPIAYWGLPLTLKAGDEATFLVLDKDPRTDAAVLLAPRQVLSRGRVLK